MNSKFIFALIAVISLAQAASIEKIEEPTPRLCIWPLTGGTVWLWPHLSSNKETFTSDNQCINTPNALFVNYRSAQAAYLEDTCVVYANSSCVGDPEYTATVTGYFKITTPWPIKSFKCPCRWR